MGILRAYSYLNQNIGVMLIFFFKINVNFPHLLWFVILVTVNGKFWRILAKPSKSSIFAKICHLQLRGRQTTTVEVSLRLF